MVDKNKQIQIRYQCRVCENGYCIVWSGIPPNDKYTLERCLSCYAK